MHRYFGQSVFLCSSVVNLILIATHLCMCGFTYLMWVWLHLLVCASVLAPPSTPPPTTTPVPTDAPTNAPIGPPAGTTNTPDSLLPLITMAMPSEGGRFSNLADPNSLSTTDTLGGDPRGGNSGSVAAAVVIVPLVLLAIVGATTFLIVFWM